MKHAFFLILFFFSQLSHSAPNTVSDDCTDYAKEKYFVEGDWASEIGGDRLWNFPQLTKNFKSSNAARCDKEVFTQALNDSHEYWEHIKTKYQCPEAAVTQCDSSETNLSYIELCRATYLDQLANVHEDVLVCEPDNVGMETAQEVAEETTEVLSHMTPTPDLCDGVPEEYLKIPGVKEDRKLDSELLACTIGVFKGAGLSAADLVENLWNILTVGFKITWKQYDLMWGFLKAAFQGTASTYLAESVAQGTDFVANIAKSLISLPLNIIERAKSDFKEWKCLNIAGQSEYACRTTAYLGAVVILGVLTAGANKAALLSKATKAMKPIEKVLGKAQDAIVNAKIAKRTKGAGSAGTAAAKAPKINLSGVLDGKRPSDYLDLDEVRAMNPKQAQITMERFLEGESREAALKRLQPGNYTYIPKKKLEKMSPKELEKMQKKHKDKLISEEQYMALQDEFKIFSNLMSNAAETRAATKAAQAAGKAEMAARTDLRGVLKGSRPSDNLSLDDVKAMDPRQASAAIEVFLKGETREAALKRLNPNNYSSLLKKKKISKEQFEAIKKEHEIYSELNAKAATRTTAQSAKKAVDGVLKGKRPSDSVSLTDVQAMTPVEARVALEVFLAGETRTAAAKRLNPHNYPKNLGKEQLDEMFYEYKIFNTLKAKAKANAYRTVATAETTAEVATKMTAKQIENAKKIAQFEKMSLKGVLEGKRPSESLSLDAVKGMDKMQAQEAMEKFLDGESKAAALKRLQPGNFTYIPKKKLEKMSPKELEKMRKKHKEKLISEDQYMAIQHEFRIFSNLMSNAAK